MGVVTVKFDAKTESFFRDHGDQKWIADVELFDQPCTKIFTPILHRSKQVPENHTVIPLRSDHMLLGKLFASSEFMTQFGSADVWEIKLKGLLKKKPEFIRPEPKIEQTCHVPVKKMDNIQPSSAEGEKLKWGTVNIKRT